MTKRAKKLPDHYKAIAIKNNLSIPTVYARIARGWDRERAVSVPPTQTLNLPRDDDGNLLPSSRPKSDRSYSFNIYSDLENTFENAVSESGMTRSDFVSNAIEYYLKNEYKVK